MRRHQLLPGEVNPIHFNESYAYVLTSAGLSPLTLAAHGACAGVSRYKIHLVRIILGNVTYRSVAVNNRSVDFLAFVGLLKRLKDHNR